jgi:heat shock transcription factor, other eukaryote
MPPTNTKKRSAPGSSPSMQAAQMPQNYAAPTHQASNQDFAQYNQIPDNQVYQDSSIYNMPSFGGDGIPQGQYDLSGPPQSSQSQNTQLARRPLNQQLVPTGQRYDNTVDNWFADDPMNDPQQGSGMEENDNIELLEEKAAVAKRDAQSKRKQIPPFVQKLSR